MKGLVMLKSTMHPLMEKAGRLWGPREFESPGISIKIGCVVFCEIIET
jgi:hypothetical protein